MVAASKIADDDTRLVEVQWRLGHHHGWHRRHGRDGYRHRDSRGWAYRGTTPMGFDFDTRQRCANPRYRDDHRPECGAGGRVGSNGVFIHSYAGGSYGYSGGGYAGSTSSPSSSVARVPQSPSTLSARPVPSARIAAPVSRGGFGSMASAHGASSGG